MVEQVHSPDTEWRQAQVAQPTLGRRLETIRQRWRLIAAATLLGLGLGILYLALTPDSYEAESRLLVKPIPADESIFAAVGLITESSDPSLGVQTAVQLVDNPEVAGSVSQQLELELDPTETLSRVDIEPIPQSYIVSITGHAETPEEAQDLANTFAEEAVDRRTAEVQRRAAEVLPRLEAQLAQLPRGGAAAEGLSATISELRFLSEGTDPTLQVESEAELPKSPSSPKPALAIGLGLAGGFLVGTMIAFALQLLDPVLRREGQMRALLPVPIIARVPRENRKHDNPILPTSMGLPSREAYRTLRATLSVAGPRGGSPRSIFITGPGAAEGKSTTALNIAISLALAGKKVIFIEADLRRPNVGKALGLKPAKGVVSVLVEESKLEDALVTTQAFGPNLQLLLADHSGPGVPELLSLRAAELLLSHAEEIADFVVIDSPPLTDVIDALPLARRAEAVLIVARLGKSRIPRIKRLAELLDANDIQPVGTAILAVPRESRRSGYYYYTEDSPSFGARENTSPEPAKQS